MNPATYILVIIALLVPAVAAGVEDFSRCDDCHSAVLERDRARYYQHQVFAQQECKACHLIPAELAAVPQTTASLVDRRKINWLGDSAMLTTQHGFLLPADQLSETLVVEVRDPEGYFTRTELDIPLLVALPSVPDSGRAPEIFDLGVVEVRRSIFLSVTIGWRTDALTAARILFGPTELNRSADTGNRVGQHHQVVLNQLQPDTTYRFQVVARDLFGREQTSEILTFSTAKPVTAVVDSTATAAPVPAAEPLLGAFFRRDSDYLFEMILPVPGTVFVGSSGAVREQSLTTAAAPTATLAPETGSVDVHAGLSTGADLTMASCRGCHTPQATATHPVNVLPKPGMVIPPEYPTLPDGRITCASCHAVHGSNNEYLARKPGKRELCVGCHQDML